MEETMLKKWFLAVMILTIVAIGWGFRLEHRVNAQSPNYDLYLPLVIKDRGQTVFGVEVGYFNSSMADKAKNVGATWVRINGLLWSDIQPTKQGGYVWQNASVLEGSLTNAAQRRLQTILIVRSTPSWAQQKPGSYCGPIKPKNLGDFAQFMHETVKRYSVYPYNVLYYELWNEPDVAPELVPGDSVFGCWGNLNDTYYGGGYYAQMLQAVYGAVKSANPNAQVVLGGLLLDCDPRNVGTGYCPNTNATRAPRFFEGVLRNNGASYFDYISFHGYPTYSVNFTPIQSEKNFPSWSASGGVVAGKINFLRSVMVQYGVDKPLLHTEGALLLGANQTPDQVGAEAFEQAKADYVVWLYARNWSLGVKGTTWYTLNGPGWRYSGLLDSNQNPLPGYTALRFMTEILNDYQYNQEILPGNDTFGFEFRKGTSKIWVVFTPDKNARVISTPSGITAAYDPLGNAVSYGTSITITRPTYLLINP
jgi:hypothetical protein